VLFVWLSMGRIFFLFSLFDCFGWVSFLFCLARLICFGMVGLVLVWFGMVILYLIWLGMVGLVLICCGMIDMVWHA
jgi:hypothetical protein